MKKLSILAIPVIIIVFQYCTSTKRALSRQSAKVTYIKNVQPVIAANCSPCHIPPQGNKEALNTYVAAKDEIDEIIERIQRNPGDKGFMPFKHAKLPDSTINVFIKWRAEGLLEK